MSSCLLGPWRIGWRPVGRRWWNAHETAFHKCLWSVELGWGYCWCRPVDWWRRFEGIDDVRRFKLLNSWLQRQPWARKQSCLIGQDQGSLEHPMGLWHLEAQAQRAHARHQLGSNASDRVVLTTRSECWALEGWSPAFQVKQNSNESCRGFLPFIQEFCHRISQ